MTPNTVLPPPTPAQIASACLSFRHDFGLLDKDQRYGVMIEAQAWLDAWRKEFAALALRPGGEPSDEQIESLVNRFRLRTNDGMREFARAVLALRPVGGADKPAPKDAA